MIECPICGATESEWDGRVDYDNPMRVLGRHLDEFHFDIGRRSSAIRCFCGSDHYYYQSLAEHLLSQGDADAQRAHFLEHYLRQL